MFFLLIIASLLLVIFSIKIFGNDYANPGIIYSMVWFIVSIFSIFYSMKFGNDISLITVVILLSGNLMFILGVLAAYPVAGKYLVRFGKPSDSTQVSNLVFILILLLFIFIIRFVYRDLSYIAAQSKQALGGIFRTIELARHMTTNYDFAPSRLTLNLLRVNYAIGIVFFYIFCETTFSKIGSKFYKSKLLCIAFVSLAISLLSTGRTELLGLVAGYGMIYILFYSKYFSWQDTKYGNRLISVLVKMGLSFIVLFVLIGVFVLNRIDSDGYLGIFNNLVKYMGSSIQAFDFFLNNINLYEPNTIFGQNTLIAVYGTMRSLGLVDYILTPFLPVVSFNGDRTNVYTIFYYFIKDFGYLSAILLPSLYGFFYGFLYYRIKNSRFNPLSIITYALLAYPLVISFFQEALLSLLTTHINRIIYAVIIYYLVRSLGKIRFKI